MAEIREVISDVKDKVGDKGFIFIIVAIIGAFIFMLLRNSEGGSNSTYIVPSGYTSYPDAVTNADVIIDSVNKNDDYNTLAILEALGDSNYSMNEQFQTMTDLIGDNFEYTNGYMEEGFKGLQNSLDEGLSGVNTSISGINSSLSGMKNDISGIKSGLDSNQKLLDQIKNQSAGSGSTDISGSGAGDYYKKTSYNGISLVDGLKSIGIYTIGGKNVGDWTSRTGLAEANGIKNYTGSASDNLKLLSLLKQGKLKKAS